MAEFGPMGFRFRALAYVTLLFALRPAGAPAQTPPEPTPTPAASEPVAAPAPEPTPVEPPAAPTDSRALLDQLGGVVESGKLNVEIDLLDGRVPAAPGWTVETKGSPLARIAAEAAQGKVQRLHIGVANAGKLLVDGKGLRPKVYIESLAFEGGKGITEAKFRGKGIWRPIVAIFRGLAMSSLRKLEFRTDIPSVLRGEIFGAKAAPDKKPGAAPAAPSPAPVAGAATPTLVPGPSFMDLVREVRVKDSELIAFAGKPLGLGEMVQFQTASASKSGTPLRVSIDGATFQPGHGGAPAHIDVAGRLDGEIENGAVAFGGSRSTFSHGELQGGTYRVRSQEAGGYQTEIGARLFALDLTSGEFHVPGGPHVFVDPPSHVGFRDLKVEPDGRFSGLFDADLLGKVGRLARGGSLVSASDIHLRTQGTRVINGRANGDVDLEFTYRVDYAMTVRYPVKQIGDRQVSLVFQGPFATQLHLENAGGADEGTVTGTYSFKVPWPPIEQAALVVLRAKWSQDIPAVMRKVEFDIEPRRFAPCGETCFLVDLGVTAEKKKGKKSLFRQICEPEGKAELVVDAPSRSFLIKNIRIETRCKGIVGWVINFISPLLTKTYTDMTLFKMPDNLPFTIEKVGSGANWLAIAGKVEWKSDAPAGSAAPTPQ